MGCSSFADKQAPSPGLSHSGVAATLTPSLSQRERDLGCSLAMGRGNFPGESFMNLPFSCDGFFPGCGGFDRRTLETQGVDRKPFWEVVRQMCAQSGWSPEQYDHEGSCLTLACGGGRWVRRPQNMQGQFMVMAASVQRKQTLLFGDPNGPSRQYSIRIDVFADPKLKIVGVNPVIDVAVATDDKGNSLVVKKGEPMEIRFPGRQSPLLLGLQAPLQILPDAGNKLVNLKGVARLSVQTKSASWDLGDPLKIAKEQQRVVNDRVTLTVRSVAPVANNPKALEVKIRIAIKRKPRLNLFGRRDDDRDPLTSFDFLQGCLKIVDAKGRTFGRGGWSGTGHGNAWEYETTFSPPDEEGGKPGGPTKMIWDVPLEIKEIEVPVEFKDLPLP